MELYLCLWSSIFVYGLLSLPGDRSLACLGDGPWLAEGTVLCLPGERSFVYGVLSLSIEFYLCIWNYIFVYGVLSLSTEFYLCLRLLGACIWKRLGACMRLLGASLIRLIACLTVGSLPDSRWLNSPRVSCSLGLGAPRVGFTF